MQQVTFRKLIFDGDRRVWMYKRHVNLQVGVRITRTELTRTAARASRLLNILISDTLKIITSRDRT